MQIDFQKIIEIYGEDILQSCSDNIDDLIDNIIYLKSLGFTDVFDIAERYPLLFLNDTTDFKIKTSSFFKKLGLNYIHKLETNLALWEELL